MKANFSRTNYRRGHGILAVIASAITIGSTIPPASCQELSASELHESCRLLVAESLETVAKRSGINLQSDSFFLSMGDRFSIAGMRIRHSRPLTLEDYKRGVDQFLIWHQGLSSSDSIVPGYYVIRTTVTRSEAIVSNLVSLSYRGLNYELPNKIVAAGADGGCEGSHVEIDGTYACLHTCGCEFVGPSHPDFGPAVGCFTVTFCF